MATKKYEEQYKDQIDSLVNKTQNSEFSYDPLQDVNYQNLAKEYGRLGERAAEDTLANAAALTGGRASSYAVTAGQQAQNQYNQALTDKIPSLYEAAYNKFATDRTNDLNMISTLQGMEDSNYGRFIDDRNYDYQLGRDSVYDSQWQQEFDNSNSQWEKEFGYQQNRDKITDSQWQKSFDTSNDQWKQQFERNNMEADRAWEQALKQAASRVSRGGSYSGSNQKEETNPKYNQKLSSNEISMVAGAIIKKGSESYKSAVLNELNEADRGKVIGELNKYNFKYKKGGRLE